MLLAPGGNAAVSCGGKPATIVRGDGDDVIRGSGGSDVIYGGGGDDRIFGRGGNDTICGGPGKDRIDGGRGNDRVNGGPGDRDYVDGGPGDDIEVAGGPGDQDVVVGNAGRDRISGGPGEHDVASYATASTPITADLRTGWVYGDVRERLVGVEDLLGGSGNDRIIGNGHANRLDGGPGNDRLTGVGPGDRAFGGSGDDLCTGTFASESSCGERAGNQHAVTVELIRSIDGSSSLTVSGSGGRDVIAVRESHFSFLATAGAGTELGTGGRGSGCVLAGTARARCWGHARRVLVSMNGGNDRFALLAARWVTSTIGGGGGADVLRGGSGNDILYGGDDHDPDALSGGAGDDVLFGINPSHPRYDSGAARMFGGPGSDLLIGGQPCDGDLFDGGPGRNDSASFARVRNSGIAVRARIGRTVTDPDLGGRCRAWRIAVSVEAIEGSSGPDRLFGSASDDILEGRDGDDFIEGEGGSDRCDGGGGRDRAVHCERRESFP
ncbi:MAG TPA: calcium-binding protein [Solirubrobacterales bacterium]|nr:calcium-binding protein [Solirubrobacterales bacterium]